MRVFWLLALALSSESGVAAAQSPPPESPAVAAAQHSAEPAEPPAPFNAWAERPFAVDLNLALSSPLGLAGFSLEYAPIRYVSIGGGVGTNFWGPQYAGLFRVRVYELKRGALFLGGGYSQGPFKQSYANRYGSLSALKGILASMGHDTPPPERSWTTARWLNVELGGETRQANGLDVRGFGGVEVLLNPSENQVGHQYPNQQGPLDVVPWVVYFGAAVGYAL